MDMIIRIAFWLVMAIVLTSFIEYLAHRFLMHRKPKILYWLYDVFQEHAVEHHAKGRTDLNIDMPFKWYYTYGLVFLIPFFALDWVGGICLFVVFRCHSYIWTKLHRAFHGLEDNWTKKTRIYQYLYEHHMNHHRKPNTNFNVVFLWVDALLGTKYRYK